MSGACPRRALSLFRAILREGRHWGVAEESEYIRTTAFELFRKNRQLTDPEAVERKLNEAEERLVLARHYRIPYPRLHHAAKGTTGRSFAAEYQKASYMDSIDM